MKKRILSFILCLAMLLSLLPVTAFAAQAYDIWVDGIRIGNYNQNDVLGDGNVSYDPGTKTLTFKQSVVINSAYENAMIYAEMENDSDTLTVVGPDLGSPVELSHWKWNAIHVNKGNLSVRGSFYIDCGGIAIQSSQGDVTISGDSRIQIVAAARGIIARNDLTITDETTLFIQSEAFGIGTGYGTVTISGVSYVDALVTNVGISAPNVVISDSASLAVTAKYGIYAFNDVAISGSGDVHITADEEGIHADDGGVTFSGSGDLNVRANTYGGIFARVNDVVFSGSGNVNVYGNDNAVQLQGSSNKVLLNGSNGSITLTSDAKGTAVFCASGESPVAGKNLSKYIVTGRPESSSVVYTLKDLVAVKDVAITSLKEPVVGEHPNTSFTVTNSKGYPLTGTASWVKYVDGIGQNMTRGDVFEAGFRYGCYITITTEEAHPFAYVMKPGSHGTAFKAFSGTLTVNGTNHSLVSVSDNELEADLVWWSDEALPNMPFVDVKNGDFFFDPVVWAVSKGITNGVDATHFGPSNDCLRAQVVTFLWRAAGQPEPKTTNNPFVDVKESDFYYKPVLWAVENKITSGMDATHFGPLEKCNRAQVVTFLYRAAGSPSVSGTNPFVDVPSGSFYEAPVLWAVSKGITNGMDATHFGPSSTCNRAQIVTFLYRYYCK